MEIPQELAEKVYKLIESVKVDGKLRKGANEVTKSIEKAEAKLVIIASDVQPQEITMHFPLLSKEKEIPLVIVPSKTELGTAAGLPVGTAAVSIVNAGDSKKQLISVLKSIETLKKGSAPEEKKEEKPKEKSDSEKQETKKQEKTPEESETEKQEKSESKEEASEEKKPEEKEEDKK